MTIAVGTKKQIRVKRQTVQGTLAGVTLGQIMRRTSGTFEFVKETYTTAEEITSTAQILSSRHGVKMVNGSLAGLLSPGTYQEQMSAVLRRDFTAVAAITGASITIAGAGPSYTITRAAGSFLTDGIDIGFGIRLTAGAFNAANTGKNLLVTAVTATVLTVLVMNTSALVAEGPIASATITVPGKTTYIPTTGHLDLFHTVETWHPDSAVSERNIDCKFTQMTFSLPGSGNATSTYTAIGLNQTADVTPYFTSPAAESTADVLTAAGGALIVNGVAVATVTDLSIDVNGNGAAADGVVGSNIRPGVFSGKVAVSGSMTVYFEGGVIPNLFINETQTSIVSALTAGSCSAADFLTFTMSRVFLNTSTPDDNETGNKRVLSFVAILNAAGAPGTGTEKTSLMVCDSAAV